MQRNGLAGQLSTAGSSLEAALGRSVPDGVRLRVSGSAERDALEALLTEWRSRQGRSYGVAS
jgi:hypothetical protein